ncbi:MAG: tRNA-dihydrouridine synthase [Candidatus Paceibacterota bacterium]|jgi:tRNA-dihydrouridine synthase
MANFWLKLKKPLVTLAPMYDVTDSAFRQTIAGFGGPDVFFTEFVSADGLASEAGRAKLLRELYFTEAERPIVAQIFGSKLETIKKAVEIIRELGFDGVDINMGCPDRAVNKIGAGAALIKTPKLAQEIIEAAKSVAGKMPVSVKMRIGWGAPDKKEFTKWFKAILKAEPAAITVHFRTRNEMSEPKAHWEEYAPLAVKLARGSGIPIMGNGDVKTVAEATELSKKYGLAGAMIGRGVFGQPWLFVRHPISDPLEIGCRTKPIKDDPCLNSKAGLCEIGCRTKFSLKTLLKHSKLFEKMYCPGSFNTKTFGGHTKNFAVMKKHFKAYVTGFPGASDLRIKLMATENSQAVEAIVRDFLKSA